VAGRSELDPTRSLAKEAALVSRAVLRWTSMQMGMRSTFDHISFTRLGLLFAYFRQASGARNSIRIRGAGRETMGCYGYSGQWVFRDMAIIVILRRWVMDDILMVPWRISGHRWPSTRVRDHDIRTCFLRIMKKQQIL
jgi:hypothetical protein